MGVCLANVSWVSPGGRAWEFFFVAFRRNAEMGEQDPKGLAEELRAAGRAASRGEKQLPGPAAVHP
ncbi:MAG TPA: hypothetical protein DCM54_05505 [Gammaproteobacteria bacterium]|nr:hypothetical protein [Gammaproteobacteria bacterium]